MVRGNLLQESQLRVPARRRSKQFRVSRIAFVVTGSIDSFTGGYIYDKKLVDYLNKSRNYKVEIISLPIRKRWFDLFANGWFALRMLLGKYNLVIEDGMIYRAVVFANFFLLRGRIPLIGIIHMVDWPSCKLGISKRLAKAFERRNLASLDRIVSNSRYTSSLLSELDVSPTKISLIYPGFDSRTDQAVGILGSSERSYSSKNARVVRLLYSGQLIPRKGLHILTEALAKLKNSNWSLTVAGNDKCDPSYTLQIRKSIEDLGLENKVRILGEVPWREMPQLYETSDIFLMPTMYEAFGMAVLEAQVHGLPSVAFAVGGVPEVIDDGVTGSLVQPFDVNQFAETVERLIKHEEIRKEFAENARRIKRKEFQDWQVVCEKFASIVDQILSSKEPNAT